MARRRPGHVSGIEGWQFDCGGDGRSGLPLAVSSGAGSGSGSASQHAIGTGVIGGMVTAAGKRIRA